MTTGSAVSSGTNPTAAYDVINHKTRLIDTGTNIQSATKIGAGQEAYATSSTGGLFKGTDLMTDPTGTIWTDKISNLLWAVKFGTFYACSATYADSASGLLTNATTTGSLSLASLDTSNGRATVFTSGASAGNQAGFRTPANWTIRKFNPTFKITWSIDEAGANVRFYAGFADFSTIVGNTDDPLNAQSGFGIGILTTQANYRILSNDGVGATVSADSGIAKDTGVHTFEAWADENGTRFLWSIDGSTPAAVSADIPAQTTTLSCQATVTAVNADAKPLSIFRALITSNR